MLKFEKLKFGDKIYVVKETNNAFARKKIKMVDQSGIEWYRYDKELWEYNIQEIEYCGKTTVIEEGDVRFDEDNQTKYHFKYPCGQIYPEYEGDEEHLDNWFTSLEQAKEYSARMKEKRND